MSERAEQNGGLHAVSATITALASVMLFVGPFVIPMWVPSCRTDASADDKNPLKDMIVIEASLAMKTNKKKATQPQKDMRPPDPKSTPEGIKKKDEPPDDKDKKVDDKPKKKDEDPKIDPNAPLPKHADDDTPTGVIVQPFNPNESTEVGHDLITKNHYVAVIKTKLDDLYHASAIDRGTSTPQGCLQLDKDGKVLDTKFNTHDSDDHQTMAEDAIKKFVADWNQHPAPIPEDQQAITSKWLCFNFKV